MCQESALARGTIRPNPDADLHCSLAYCEIYVTLGTLFRRFENLHVVGTTPAEVLDFDDWFGPYMAKGARPMQVVANN